MVRRTEHRCASFLVCVDQIVDGPMPQVVVDIVVEQIVDVPVLEIQEGIAEQIVDFAVPAIKKELAGVPATSTSWSRQWH